MGVGGTYLGWVKGRVVKSVDSAYRNQLAIATTRHSAPQIKPSPFGKCPQKPYSGKGTRDG